jgi:hypothetical protein
MGVVTHKGATYPVTDAWDAVNNAPWPDLAALSRLELRALQDQLLTISNQRALAPAEAARLAAANNHFDVRTAIDFLDGRDIADFGFTGVDQVHGNRQTFGCGCQLHTVFDHGLRGDPGNLTLYPHVPRAVCDTHAPLNVSAWEALHEKVIADNTPPPTDS